VVTAIWQRYGLHSLQEVSMEEEFGIIVIRQQAKTAKQIYSNKVKRRKYVLVYMVKRY
jgi:hypothetical protein